MVAGGKGEPREGEEYKAELRIDEGNNAQFLRESHAFCTESTLRTVQQTGWGGELACC